MRVLVTQMALLDGSGKSGHTGIRSTDLAVCNELPFRRINSAQIIYLFYPLNEAALKPFQVKAVHCRNENTKLCVR